MSQTSSQHLSDTAQVDQQSIQPFPNSRKIYVQGSRPDILVPMREIRLTPHIPMMALKTMRRCSFMTRLGLYRSECEH